MKQKITLTVSLAMMLAACATAPTSIPTATAPPLPTATLAPILGDYGCPLTTATSASPAGTVTLGPPAGIPASPAGGEELIIIGTAYAKDCTPLSGVTLELWQTDGAGEYGPGHASGDMQCCYYQGSVTTDVAGLFQIITVRPGYYAGQTDPPPAHVHARVRYQNTSGLETEFVFRDDPQLLGDPINYGLIPLTLLDTHAIGDIVLKDMATQAPSNGPRTFRIASDSTLAAYHIRETFADIASMITAVAATPLVEGEIAVELSEPPSAQVVTMTVDLRGLDSGEPSRDEKLADRWLVTNQFPFAYFVSTEIRNAPASYTEGAEANFTLAGKLTIREITRPMVFEVRATLDDQTLTGHAEGHILMSDFGIEPPNIFDFVVVEDEVLITMDFVARAD